MNEPLDDLVQEASHRVANKLRSGEPLQDNDIDLACTAFLSMKIDGGFVKLADAMDAHNKICAKKELNIQRAITTGMTIGGIVVGIIIGLIQYVTR